MSPLAHTDGVVQHMSPVSQQYCLFVLGSVAQASGGEHVQVYCPESHVGHTKPVAFDVNMSLSK